MTKLQDVKYLLKTKKKSKGVAIYINQHIPFKEINLDTDLQAVAVEIALQFKTVLCNIYNSRLHSPNVNKLKKTLRSTTIPNSRIF